MVVFIAVGAIIVLLLIAAAFVDYRDRKEGRNRKSAKQLGEDIRAARRAQRATLVGRNWLPRVRPDRQQGTPGYVAPDGSRRPINRDR